jgi:hypothetical protein
MLPSVSEPKVTAARPMDAATADPEDDPHGSALGKYAFVHWPPRPDHPWGCPLMPVNSAWFALPIKGTL